MAHPANEQEWEAVCVMVTHILSQLRDYHFGKPSCVYLGYKLKTVGPASGHRCVGTIETSEVINFGKLVMIFVAKHVRSIMPENGTPS